MKTKDKVLFVILLASCILAFFVADNRLFEVISAFLGVIVCCAWFATDAICSAIKGRI